MPLLTINASDIDTAGVAIDAELPVSWIDQELGDADVRGQLPGRVQARLSRSGNEIVVRGRVDAKVTTPCARCLDPAPVDVTGELSLLLKAAPPERGGTKGKAAKVPNAGKANANANANANALPRAGGAEARGRAATATRAGAPSGASARHPRGDGRAQDEYEFSSNEAEVDTYDGETVVLDSFVREAILLEMPNFPLCSEACPGIRDAPAAPALGRQEARGIDPRLAPLGALRAKLGAPPPPPKPRAKATMKLKANVAAKPKPKKKRK
jgi:uncharacterized protein